MKKNKFLSTLQICICTIFIIIRSYYEDMRNQDKSTGMQYILVHAANSINRNPLTNNPEETYKTVEHEEMPPGSYPKSEEKCNNETKLTSITLRANCTPTSNIESTKKKKIIYILELLKKMDKYGEKKTFKYLSYLYSLKKDPNMTKKLFIKKVLRRYGLFIFSPVIIKLIVTIVPAVAYATHIFKTYTYLFPIYVTFHILVAHLLGAASVLSLIYLLIKKVKFDMIADSNPKLCYTEYSSFLKHIFI
ncbi:hypothetical protein PKNA1_C2_0725100 [Plasmodium knowlesi strain H]|uniref:Variable surface protein n=3 Tax=Plasmodium knowlesi TaxID=5850 RepID=A0A5E7WZB9_PLAKH|nr:Plasmodium exported protein, unknown function [Plasmodium knowlesi strain H]OTN67535.1 Uncharacterized protein PKNOH_S06427000 [Plasmodium knowlesi]CAA9987541.1 Plasmodium exported protein, unknown function [Plasmodium knowlesi strain H]SBO23091.1 hypothetical protein PKNA1_C2_0725100 [Plasmodium knowlesi strain H]SBO23751.1 hypothetical protein PKNA1_H1_0725100 [Plasmodium knowlesi strain H]VVS77015.1 Plasmodium exported protein, unknown function [Plasmodium knowlesi strain H]